MYITNVNGCFLSSIFEWKHTQILDIAKKILVHKYVDKHKDFKTDQLQKLFVSVYDVQLSKRKKGGNEIARYKHNK